MELELQQLAIELKIFLITRVSDQSILGLLDQHELITGTQANKQP